MTTRTQEGAYAEAEELAAAMDAEAQAVDLSAYAPEDWLGLAVFWVMVVLVFLQFFTRYVLNNSLAWTEEVAMGALAVLVFIGSAMCVRLTRHIQVNVLYHYLPAPVGRWLSRLVDVICVAFFVYGSWLMWRYTMLVSDETMTSVDLPRAWVYGGVLLGFVLMALRSVQVLVQNLRRGYSALERPEAFDGLGD